MTWTSELECMLKDWAVRISRRSTQHVFSSRYFKRHGSFLMYIAIFTTFGAGFVDLIGGSQKERLDPISITSGCLAMLGGIASTIVKFSNVLDLKQLHKSAAGDYNVLFQQIQLQLALKRSERDPDTKFFPVVIKEFQRIQEVSPIIPEKIEQKEERVFARKQQYLPGVISHPSIVRYQNQKNGQNKKEEEAPVGDDGRRRSSIDFWKYPYGFLNLEHSLGSHQYIHTNPTAVPLFCSSSDNEEGGGSQQFEFEEGSVSSDQHHTISVYEEPTVEILPNSSERGR